MEQVRQPHGHGQQERQVPNRRFNSNHGAQAQQKQRRYAQQRVDGVVASYVPNALKDTVHTRL